MMNLYKIAKYYEWGDNGGVFGWIIHRRCHLVEVIKLQFIDLPKFARNTYYKLPYSSL